MPPNSNSTVNFEPSQLLTETPDPSDDEDLIQFVNLNKTFKHKPVSELSGIFNQNR